MKKDEHKHERAKKIMKQACYAAGGKVQSPSPPPSTDGEPDDSPIPKKKSGGKVHGKSMKHRSDKKSRGKK